MEKVTEDRFIGLSDWLALSMLQEAEVKGVDQDEGLSKMLDSGSSSEDENKKKDDKDKDEVKNYSHYCSTYPGMEITKNKNP